VRRHTVSDIVNFIHSLPEGTRYQVLAPLSERSDRSLE
jgi:hypothetical protein